jgi:hypothetical protein
VTGPDDEWPILADLKPDDEPPADDTEPTGETVIDTEPSDDEPADQPSSGSPIVAAVAEYFDNPSGPGPRRIFTAYVAVRREKWAGPQSSQIKPLRGCCPYKVPSEEFVHIGHVVALTRSSRSAVRG